VRAPHATGAPVSVPSNGEPVDRKAQARADRDAQKKLKAVERKISKLDDEKRAVSEQLLSVTEAAEAQRLHTQLTETTAQLAKLEEEWLQLSTELESA
jgi:hypothetical protein